MFKDLSNQKFNRLKVLYRVENDKHGKARWACVCDCGQNVIVIGSALIRGNTKSCGCLFKEVISSQKGRKVSTSVCRTQYGLDFITLKPIYIYKILNKINGKIYVGQTSRSLKIRWEEHWYKSKFYSEKPKPLYCAFRKYGIENFSISELGTANTQRWANYLEETWIKILDTTNKSKGYNLTANGRIYFSEEICLKISRALKGRVSPTKGKKLSEETKKKLSAAHTGKIVSKETREKLSQSKLGDKNPNWNPLLHA